MKLNEIFDGYTYPGSKEDQILADRQRKKRGATKRFQSMIHQDIVHHGGQLEWMKDRIESNIQEYGCAKTARLIQKWYDEDRIDEETAKELLAYCDSRNPAHDQRQADYANMDYDGPDRTKAGKYELE